ncbi:hypothetical protein J3R83DRAFT_11305, partial [Lanmaoa asiatica]
WYKSMEDLANVMEDKLWVNLGFHDKVLPFFHKFTDPNGSIKLWTKEGEKWLASLMASTC